MYKDLDELKSHLSEYVGEITQKSKGKGYICPICGSGTGTHKTGAFSIIPDSNDTAWKCFSCNHNGTIIDLYAILNNVNDKTAIKELSEKYRLTGKKKPQNNHALIPKEEKSYIKERIIKDIEISHNYVDNTAYMLRRGILEEVLQRFNIGFIPNWIHPSILYKMEFGIEEERRKYVNVQPTPRVIIPTSKESYLARDIRSNVPDSAKSFTKMKSGETHILNVDTLKTNKIVFVVEGEIDALSLISLGYETIGLGSTSMINQLTEKMYYNIIGECSKSDRPILIFALDNDDAGRKSTSNALKLCKIHNIPCICVDNSFYGTSKDGNDALINNRNELLINLKKEFERAKNFDFNTIEEETHENKTLPQDIDYITEEFDKKSNKMIFKVCPPLLAKHIRKTCHYIFVRNEALEGVTRYWYEHGVYNLISDDELKGHIKSYITTFDDSILKKKDIEEVFFDLTTDLNYIPHNKLNADENLINFKNGLLNLETMELIEHSPKIYSTIQLDCNYNPNATDSPIFDKYLKTFTQGNKKKEQLLLEYMGACFSNVYGFRYKQSLFMVGASNSGKSTLKRFTESIIGDKYISSATLEQLEARFGGTYIHNKRLIGSSDMPYASIRALDMFKALTGGDSISIEYKCKNVFSEIFKGFLWFTMNKLPKISGNQGDEVYNRIILFRCDNVIPNEQMDKNLDNKLLKEKETIINKCLKAFRQTIDNNYTFTVPDDSIIEKKQYQEENNPVVAFYKECCTERPNGKYDKCTTKVMYDVFKAWCLDNNNGYFPSNIEFRKELLNIFKTTDISSIIIRRNSARYYLFTLTLETKTDYSKIYGYDSSTSNE